VTPRTGWWRANRWWLLALPFAVAVLLGASAYNVKHYWYDGGLHDRLASADAGDYATATDHYEDAIGETSRTYRVRLASIDETATYPRPDGPAPPPKGTTAWRVWLDWEADPSQTLRYCTVSLVDDQGRRYDTDQANQLDPCTPEGHDGPDQPLSADGDRLAPEGAERPPAWSTAAVVLVPEGRRITQVRVWWETPDYVQLSAP